MKLTLSTYEAAERLFNDENANWTRAGAFALVDHLEEYEEECGRELNFCPVAIRCDFSEYESLEAFRDEYFSDTEQCLNAIKADETNDADERDDLTREWIRDYGDLIEFDGGIIVSSF